MSLNETNVKPDPFIQKLEDTWKEQEKILLRMSDVA